MNAIDRVRAALAGANRARTVDDLQVWRERSTVVEQEAAQRARRTAPFPAHVPSRKESSTMQLTAATATNPTATGLDLTFRFRDLTPEQAEAGAELVREVHAAAADGKISTEEATAILVDVVALMNPVLAERIDPLQTTLARALRDGKVSVREGVMIGFGLVEAFGG